MKEIDIDTILDLDFVKEEIESCEHDIDEVKDGRLFVGRSVKQLKEAIGEDYLDSYSTKIKDCFILANINHEGIGHDILFAESCNTGRVIEGSVSDSDGLTVYFAIFF